MGPLILVRPAGVEPAAFGSEVQRSIHLSYGRSSMMAFILTYLQKKRIFISQAAPDKCIWKIWTGWFANAFALTNGYPWDTHIRRLSQEDDDAFVVSFFSFLHEGLVGFPDLQASAKEPSEGRPPTTPWVFGSPFSSRLRVAGTSYPH